MKTYEIKFKVKCSETVNDDTLINILHKLAFEMELEWDFVNQVACEKGFGEPIMDLLVTSIKDEENGNELFNHNMLLNNELQTEEW